MNNFIALWNIFCEQNLACGIGVGSLQWHQVGNLVLEHMYQRGAFPGVRARNTDPRSPNRIPQPNARNWAGSGEGGILIFYLLLDGEWNFTTLFFYLHRLAPWRKVAVSPKGPVSQEQLGTAAASYGKVAHTAPGFRSCCGVRFSGRDSLPLCAAQQSWASETTSRVSRITHECRSAGRARMAFEFPPELSQCWFPGRCSLHMVLWHRQRLQRSPRFPCFPPDPLHVTTLLSHHP